MKIFLDSKEWLNNYFLGKTIVDFEGNVRLIGTEFRKKVWTILRQIPYGTTISYKDVANHFCKVYNLENMSHQVIGSAIGCNPLLIFIPCHRVLARNGSLSGFSAEIENKRKLLDIENR